MNSTMTARVRRRTAIALCDYTGFSDTELIAETMNLHSTLASAGDFGRLAELGIRHTVIERLLMIDDEHARRQHWPTAA